MLGGDSRSGVSREAAQSKENKREWKKERGGRKREGRGKSQRQFPKASLFIPVLLLLLIFWVHSDLNHALSKTEGKAECYSSPLCSH